MNTNVYCNKCDCMHREGAMCNAACLTINDDMECTSYRSYRETSEYQNVFYRLCRNDDGKLVKMKDHGRRFVFGGLVFYSTERPSSGAEYTEEHSGMNVGTLDEICARISTISTYKTKLKNVRDYPTAGALFKKVIYREGGGANNDG